MAALFSVSFDGGNTYHDRPQRANRVPNVGEKLYFKELTALVVEVGLVVYSQSQQSMAGPVAKVSLKVLQRYVDGPLGPLDTTDSPVQVRQVLDPATGLYREEAMNPRPAPKTAPVFNPSAPFTLEQEQELIRQDEEARAKKFKHLQPKAGDKL